MTHNKIYVASVWWRDNDVLYSVAGWDSANVSRLVNKLMIETIENAVQDDDSDLPESEIRANLDGDLCFSGIQEFEWPQTSLGIPAENVAELESDGITVY